MGHHVTSEQSDYFQGYCDIPDCTQKPCLSCVAAQHRLEQSEQLRGEIATAYYDHHGDWPQSDFVTAIVAIVEKRKLTPR